MIDRFIHCAARDLAVVFVALLGAGAAHAQKIRPGLWENTVAIKSSGGQAEAAMARMQEQLASMPPEQRAQIEAMMARQGLGMAAGKPNTVRSCVSPEMAARNEMHSGDGRCKSTGHTRTGNTVRFKFVCQGEGASGDGEGEFTLVSDTESQGKMWVNAERGGRAMRIDMESTSRWVAAQCGEVKPTR